MLRYQVDEKSYFGLAPNKEVHLKYAPLYITCTDFKKDTDGTVTEVPTIVAIASVTLDCRGRSSARTHLSPQRSESQRSLRCPLLTSCDVAAFALSAAHLCR